MLLSRGRPTVSSLPALSTPWFRTLTSAVLLIAVSMLVDVQGASAAPYPPSSAPSASIVGQGHAMGSTIRSHEGSPSVSSRTMTASSAPAGIPGMDVSGWQGNVDWTRAKANGAEFAYIKATEGTGFTSGYFASQYNGAFAAGVIRGAYHFALPDRSTGKAQADFFVGNGGGWSPDGDTLPPLLDIEYNPYGDTCYGLSQAKMVQWINDFANTVIGRTGRAPAIYTTADWWTRCTGNNAGLSDKPLFIAAYSTWVGPMPASWDTYSFWQHADSGIFPGDQDVFNGTLRQLTAFAAGPGPAFTDVGTANQFFAPINWMAATHISTGYPDGTYRPLSTVNRDAMAAFLYRLAGSPTYTAPSKSPFTDMGTTGPYYKEICWLASTGITTGYPDGTYRPLNTVNRDAMAAFLYRLASSPTYTAPPTSSFTDMGTTDPFYKEISWLASTGITTGYPDSTYRPLNTVNRDAMAAFLYRFRNTL
ncbi:S-layer homology domain-containing protein [Paenarthrobacter sp. Z7-10]|uniref:GH25 family lysozyme n=1 Tax=Paenarthrobacter sp. Z7-10 TaxID=2787635 RepID=UPI0022A99AF4|nr:GH25 family lysozyme [Paenarthrobacter sp. Z7-10]MCZ2403859.1 S-layer homology domain-containing protein [Paenarthrobacter sp. Z7-10]